MPNPYLKSPEIPKELLELVPGIRGKEEGYLYPTQRPNWMINNLPAFQGTLKEPITKEQIPVPSLQRWGKTTERERNLLAGYANYTGQSMNDLLDQMERMRPYDPRGASWSNWRPVRQWG